MMIRNFTSNATEQGKFYAAVVLMDKISCSSLLFWGKKIRGFNWWRMLGPEAHVWSRKGEPRLYKCCPGVLSRKRYQNPMNLRLLWRLFGFGIGKYSMFTAPSSHQDDVCIDLSWESKGNPPKATSPKDPFHPRHGTQLFFSPNSNTNSCHKY